MDGNVSSVDVDFQVFKSLITCILFLFYCRSALVYLTMRHFQRSNDHVHLKAEHIPTLQVAFETVVCDTGFGTFPYVPPVMQCPYYYYVGKKVAKECPI